MNINWRFIRQTEMNTEWNVNLFQIVTLIFKTRISLVFRWFSYLLTFKWILVGFYGISTIEDFLMRNPHFTYIRGSLNKFPDIFVRALLLRVPTWNSSLLRSNRLRLQCTCTVPTTSGWPHRSLLVTDLCHSLFPLLNCLITTASELRE